MWFKKARMLYVLSWLMAGAAAWAGQYRLQLGQANRVPVGIEVRNAETQCNVEIRIDGGPPMNYKVSAPDFTAWIMLTPNQAGPMQVSWKGVFYRNAKDELLNPCPTMGQTRFLAAAGNEIGRAHV